MHELSLAIGLLGQATNILDKEKAKEALSITVSIGAMSGVEKGAFEFAFSEIKKGTILENTALVIEEVPLTVKCTNCQKESSPDLFYIGCTSCYSQDIEILKGKDFILKSMEAK